MTISLRGFHALITTISESMVIYSYKKHECIIREDIKDTMYTFPWLVQTHLPRSHNI
jgi:hypothetical protein